MNKSRPELKAPLTVVGRLSVLVDIQVFLLYPSANAQAKELVKQFHAREGYEGRFMKGRNLKMQPENVPRGM